LTYGKKTQAGWWIETGGVAMHPGRDEVSGRAPRTAADSMELLMFFF